MDTAFAARPSTTTSTHAIRPSGPVMSNREWQSLMDAMYRHDPYVRIIGDRKRTCVVVADDFAIVEHIGLPGDTLTDVCTAIDSLLGPDAARALINPARVVVNDRGVGLDDPENELRLVVPTEIAYALTMNKGVALDAPVDYFED